MKIQLETNAIEQIAATDTHCLELDSAEELDQLWERLARDAGQEHRILSWCTNFSYPLELAKFKWVKVIRWKGVTDNGEFNRLYIEFPASKNEARGYAKRYQG